MPSTTFTPDQISRAVRARPVQELLSSVHAQAVGDRAWRPSPALGRSLAGALAVRLTDADDEAYCDYVADTLSDELDMDALAEPTWFPEAFAATGVEGITQHLAAFVLDAAVLDRDDWARA